MAEQHPGNPDTAFTPKPSFMPRTLTRTFTALGGYEKSTCDEVGPCMGYSDPCGADCFRAVSRRSSHGPGLVRQGTFGRSFAGPLRFAVPEDDEDSAAQSPQTQQAKPSGVKRNVSQTSFDHVPLARSRSATHHFHHQPTQNGHPDGSKKRRPSSSFSMGQESHAQAHHHHIPNNAFMSIGLQTSIAIAVHKLPEGFITYATNHANPTLGFSVFMALFIHNITEGFAMALPLYLALNSRVKAIIWSSILGGASQPLGAGLAALWFKMAGEGSMKPGDRVYGGMFAVTAGIMTSVALSLFSESLSMTHSKGLCITFAFLGMGVLGISSALTA
ncbi:putative zip zinc transporter [Phaeomoniella chlamydospora]|uniref:Putative zip zinc transporter n=1 Tax=Phaeomoniella chlamydospora TaxID=158046 RepID=A0A0G2GJ63_PHACM|nr:putative zip zinc transporter [Phaeomoniella chlamydospora]